MEDYLAGEPNQIVVDYLASMTDSYFMALYGHLFPRSDKQVVVFAYEDICQKLMAEWLKKDAQEKQYY